MSITKTVVLAILTALTPALCHSEELTRERFLELHEQLQPDPSEVWRSIPWKTNLLEAQQEAAQQGRPIFIWAMDGHPLGCT
jgi:hypothetical protein